MAFTKLKSIHYKRLQRSFEDSEFMSWGIIDENGKLTNAGALVADESPMRQSRVFCTRWNGLDKASGLGEASDDSELEGSVVGQFQEAVTFVRNNSHKRWWKESDHREELPDYPERAVAEIIANALIHRDYMVMGSEVHIDIYDDRLEVYSPGGMMDGSMIQNVDPLTVSSKRRNPLLADFFSRLDLAERRGSGMKKIMDAYKPYAHLVKYRAPEFRSNATEFHAILWNMNYEANAEKGEEIIDSFTEQFSKEFVKATRQIYKLITYNPNINATQIAEKTKLSSRQIQKYMKRLQELQKIERVGGRKLGHWKIIDEEYEGFFDRI